MKKIILFLFLIALAGCGANQEGEYVHKIKQEAHANVKVVEILPQADKGFTSTIKLENGNSIYVNLNNFPLSVGSAISYSEVKENDVRISDIVVLFSGQLTTIGWIK